MDFEELKRLLKVTGVPKDVAGPSKDEVVTRIVEQPFAVADDQWSVRKAHELVEGAHDEGVSEADAADCWAAAYDSLPTVRETCTDPAKRSFFETLFASPDYEMAHEDSFLDEDLAAETASTFLEKLKEIDRTAKDPDPLEPVRKAAEAAREAEELTSELAEGKMALGGEEAGGYGEAKRHGKLDPKKALLRFREALQNPMIQRVVKLTGRFRRAARSRQRRKSFHARDELVGVTMGRDLDLLLPTELALLTHTHPGLKMEALIRLVEGKSLQFERSGKEPSGRGPVIFVVDESGSMMGSKVEAAKGMALAMAWLAKSQRRWCALVAYSGNTGERLLRLKTKWDEGQVLEWLLPFLSGGSSLDVPLKELPRYLEELQAPRGKTDVVMVTDAVCYVPPQIGTRFIDWKKRHSVKVQTVVVGADGDSLRPFSDSLIEVKSLGPEIEELESLFDLGE